MFDSGFDGCRGNLWFFLEQKVVVYTFHFRKENRFFSGKVKSVRIIENRMRVGGTRMARDHSLTHSILINLFIKVGLNISSPASPAKYCFCRRVLNGLYSLGKVLWRAGGGGGGGGTRMAYIF